MTTESFAPHHGAADPATGTAPIAPVTSEMLDHAAHAAAEQADAVAHEAPASAPDGTPIAVGSPAPEERGTTAPEAVAAAASEPVGPADLAFTQGPTGIEPTLERGTRTAEATFGLGVLNAKIMEITAANMAAAGELVSALMAARTVPEAAAVNADHMRRAFDALTSQSRELMLLGQKAVLGAVRPPGESSRKP